ncbi:MAG: hypothetical protein MUF72_14470 [Elainella sp. Prado103]|jgi:hypothetical protein|nr:hypothetical protein [Elainella sp. Prado103]
MATTDLQQQVQYVTNAYRDISASGSLGKPAEVLKLNQRGKFWLIYRVILLAIGLLR